MGVTSKLAAIELTADMISRGHARGIDARHFLRAAQTKLGDVVRDLTIVRSTMPHDDENQITIEVAIEALR